MTIATTTATVTYAGTSSDSALATTFPFVGEDDLIVTQRVTATGVETTMVKGTDYTVKGGGAGGSTGTVQIASGIGATKFQTGVHTWTISRDTTLTQSTDYVSNDNFPAESHEDALDKLTLIAQDLSGETNRALKIPMSDSASLVTELPSSVTRANNLLGFDASGNPAAITMANAGITTLAVDSTFSWALSDHEQVMRLVVDALDFETQFEEEQGGNKSKSGLVVAIETDPASVVLQVNAIAAYVDVFKDSGTNNVGGYFSLRASVDDAQCFGLNPILQSETGIQNAKLTNEFDFNVKHASVTVEGVRLVIGNGSVTPTNANGFIVDVVQTGTVEWGTGFLTLDQTCVLGMLIGTRQGTTTVDSQRIRMRSRDGAGVEQLAEMYCDSNGSLLLRSGVNGGLVALQDFNSGGGDNLLTASSTLITSLKAHQFDGNVGFYTTSPVAQPADAGALTDSTGGGAPDGDVQAVSGSGADVAINNNFREVLTKINSVRTALRALGLMA